MPLTKQQKRKNREIQREQTKLVKLQKELEHILVALKDAANVLKVEELQLKSDAVNDFSERKTETALRLEPSTSKDALLNITPKTSNSVVVRRVSKDNDVINRQHVDLNVYKPGNMEEDDE